MATLVFVDNTISVISDDGQSSNYQRSFKVNYLSPSQSVDLELDPEHIDNCFNLTDYPVVQPSFSHQYSEETLEDRASKTQEIEKSSTLMPILDILKQGGIDIRTALSNGEYVDLDIESNNNNIYALPWESLYSTGDRRVRITRKGYKSIPKKFETKNDNYLLLLSHSYLDYPKDYGKIADDFKIETEKIFTNILGQIMDDRNGKNKPQLTVFRYLSMESINQLDLSSYSVVHLMLHGRDNGDIGFEDPTDQWRIRWVNPDDLSDILRGHNYGLVFLSCCYSGYRSDGRPSHAQALIKNNIARSVIAFSGRIGSTNAIPDFVGNFYEQYVQSNDVKLAFHLAVDKLYSDKNEYAQKPVLYMGGRI
jgi:hypothetical protein